MKNTLTFLANMIYLVMQFLHLQKFDANLPPNIRAGFCLLRLEKPFAGAVRRRRGP